MEIIELAKELFNGREVRIYGTPDKPLFAAVDIGTLLGIKNIRQNINDFDDTKRVYVKHTSGGEVRELIALTEKGLYSILFSSRKKEAVKFQDWVFKVIEEIRKTGKYVLAEDIEKQKLQEELATHSAEIVALKQENAKLAEGYKPAITYHDYDINEFTDEPCIYLIHITGNDFKFGRTGGIDDRVDTHFANFRKLGFESKIINLWECKTMKIMKDTEMKIKLLAKHNGILAAKYGQKEIIDTDNIDYIVKKITIYVTEQNSQETTIMRLKEKELDNRNKELENENLRLQIELLRLQKDLPKEKDGSPADIPPDAPIIQKDISAEARKWLADNPPADNEPSADCYAKYKLAFPDGLRVQLFNKLVEELGYKKLHGKVNYWSKKK
jgi:prophage antirepressor-like protein